MANYFGDGRNIYSVDMMFAYLNLFGYPISTINVSDYVPNLSFKIWGDPSESVGKPFSPIDVINNPKKYPDDYDRIINADLSYPIILHNEDIVDGAHRLSKAYIEGVKQLKAYKFGDSFLNKFIINTDYDWNAVEKLNKNDYIEIFHRRFL